MAKGDPVIDTLCALNELRIPYMLVGSYSSNHYGIARNTQDADFVVQMSDAQLSLLMGKLPGTHKLESQVSFETVTGETKFELHIEDSGFIIELFLLSDDEYDASRWSRRVKQTICGQPAFLPTAEDVIINKLRWALIAGRTKDVDDTVNVVAVQQASLDWKYIEHWCGKLGTTGLIEMVKKKVAQHLGDADLPD